MAAAVNDTVRRHAPFDPAAPAANAFGIWGGEIGPHNGGSPPCDHTSMRWARFGDSIWYADALASKARHGYTGFCRQDYVGADYGLVDCSTGVPLPDFWTALTFATTMGPTVLRASIVKPTRAVNVYAHCTAAGEGGGGNSGAVTVLVINLSNVSTVATFDGDGDGDLGRVSRAYVLTGSDDPATSLVNETGVMGTGIELNGAVLTAGKDGTVEPLAGKAVGKDAVEVPATSVSFFVFADAKHSACL